MLGDEQLWSEIAYALVAVLVALAGYWQRESAKKLGNGVQEGLGAMSELARNLPLATTTPDTAGLVAELGELRQQLVNLQRQMNDLDDSTERRFRRISARARRAEGEDDAEEPPQLTLPGGLGARPTPAAAPAHPPRLVRRQRGGK